MGKGSSGATDISFLDPIVLKLYNWYPYCSLNDILFFLQKNKKHHQGIFPTQKSIRDLSDDDLFSEVDTFFSHSNREEPNDDVPGYLDDSSGIPKKKSNIETSRDVPNFSTHLDDPPKKVVMGGVP